jgi:hypothetical protein
MPGRSITLFKKMDGTLAPAAGAKNIAPPMPGFGLRHVTALVTFKPLAAVLLAVSADQQPFTATRTYSAKPKPLADRNFQHPGRRLTKMFTH